MPQAGNEPKHPCNRVNHWCKDLWEEGGELELITGITQELCVWLLLEESQVQPGCVGPSCIECQEVQALEAIAGASNWEEQQAGEILRVEEGGEKGNGSGLQTPWKPSMLLLLAAIKLARTLTLHFSTPSSLTSCWGIICFTATSIAAMRPWKPANWV
jgi:hypothetical protein